MIRRLEVIQILFLLDFYFHSNFMEDRVVGGFMEGRSDVDHILPSFLVDHGECWISASRFRDSNGFYGRKEMEMESEIWGRKVV